MDKWDTNNQDSRIRDIFRCFCTACFCLPLKIWWLHYPQCNLATGWHHWRHVIRLHAASSGATKGKVNESYIMLLSCAKVVELSFNSSLGNLILYIKHYSTYHLTCKCSRLYEGRTQVIEQKVRCAFLANIHPLFKTSTCWQQKVLTNEKVIWHFSAASHCCALRRRDFSSCTFAELTILCHGPVLHFLYVSIVR